MFPLIVIFSLVFGWLREVFLAEDVFSHPSQSAKAMLEVVQSGKLTKTVGNSIMTHIQIKVGHVDEESTLAVRRLQSCKDGNLTSDSDYYTKQCSNAGTSCNQWQSVVADTNCKTNSSGTCVCTYTCSCGRNQRGNTGQLIVILVYNAVWVLLQLLFGACMWGSIRMVPVLDPLPRIGSGYDFDAGLCACCEDMNICCCTCWCPAVRAATTMHKGKVKTFWPALLTVVITWLIPVYVGYLATFLIFFMWRMQLRRKAGLQEACVSDFCCTFFCGCLTTCQEAAHVEKAYIAATSAPTSPQAYGSPAAAYGGGSPYGQTPTYGQAVAVGQPVAVPAQPYTISAQPAQPYMIPSNAAAGPAYVIQGAPVK